MNPLQREQVEALLVASVLWALLVGAVVVLVWAAVMR